MPHFVDFLKRKTTRWSPLHVSRHHYLYISWNDWSERNVTIILSWKGFYLIKNPTLSHVSAICNMHTLSLINEQTRCPVLHAVHPSVAVHQQKPFLNLDHCQQSMKETRNTRILNKTQLYSDYLCAKLMRDDPSVHLTASALVVMLNVTPNVQPHI